MTIESVIGTIRELKKRINYNGGLHIYYLSEDDPKQVADELVIREFIHYRLDASNYIEQTKQGTPFNINVYDKNGSELLIDDLKNGSQIAVYNLDKLIDEVKDTANIETFLRLLRVQSFSLDKRLFFHFLLPQSYQEKFKELRTFSIMPALNHWGVTYQL
jgi:hypothetical protein